MELIPAVSIQRDLILQLCHYSKTILVSYDAVKNSGIPAWMSNMLGLKKVKLFVDSGGFQAMNRGDLPGAMTVYQFQQKYADIGVSLDMPLLPNDDDKTRLKKMDKSLDNIEALFIEWNKELKKGEVSENKLEILLAVHGTNRADISYYCSKFQHLCDEYKWNENGFGFAIGSLAFKSRINDIQYVAEVLKMMAEFFPPVVTHVFGVGNFRLYPLLQVLGFKSFDASTYTVATRYGELISPLLRRWTIGKKNEYKLTRPLPCFCPYCEQQGNMWIAKTWDFPEWSPVNMLMHNYLIMKQEVELVRVAHENNELEEHIKRRYPDDRDLINAITYLEKGTEMESVFEL